MEHNPLQDSNGTGVEPQEQEIQEEYKQVMAEFTQNYNAHFKELHEGNMVTLPLSSESTDSSTEV